MANYLKTTMGDVTIRAGGGALLAVSWVAIGALLRLAASVPSAAMTVTGGLLATLGFLAASAGTAGVIVGRHLLDRIEVSSRWRRHPADEGRHPSFAQLSGRENDAVDH